MLSMLRIGKSDLKLPFHLCKGNHITWCEPLWYIPVHSSCMWLHCFWQHCMLTLFNLFNKVPSCRWKCCNLCQGHRERGRASLWTECSKKFIDPSPLRQQPFMSLFFTMCVSSYRSVFNWNSVLLGADYKDTAACVKCDYLDWWSECVMCMFCTYSWYGLMRFKHE